MEHVLGLNMTKLIKTVESIPIIWDPSHVDYQKRLEKQHAWKEVCEIVIENFNDLDASNKHIVEKAVKSRWSNVRDYFIKTARAAMNPDTEPVMKKKYIYYDLLLFLMKTITKENGDDSSVKTDQEALEFKQDSDTINLSDESLTDVTSQTPIKRKLSYSHPTTHKTEIKMPKDEDAAFLESILPAIKKISSENKLGFRIEMLSLLQKYIGCDNDDVCFQPQAKENPRRYAKTYHKHPRIDNDGVKKQVHSETHSFQPSIKVDVEEYDPSEPEPELFEETYTEFNEPDI